MRGMKVFFRPPLLLTLWYRQARHLHGLTVAPRVAVFGPMAKSIAVKASEVTLISSLPVGVWGISDTLRVATWRVVLRGLVRLR